MGFDEMKERPNEEVIALLLMLIMMISLTACGSKNETTPSGASDEPADTSPESTPAPVPEAEEKPDPYALIGDYVGIYYLTECVSDEEDLTDFYKEHWSDKSVYCFVYINDQCEFIEYFHTNGQTNDAGKEYFNPATGLLYTNKQQMEFGTSKGDPVSVENGVITLDRDGTHEVFVLTDELPIPEG